MLLNQAMLASAAICDKRHNTLRQKSRSGPTLESGVGKGNDLD